MTPLDFIERWICCGRIDDADVVDDIVLVRMNPDELSEQMIEYTHDPEERHMTHRPDYHIITDNGDQVDEAWNAQIVDVNADTMVSTADAVTGADKQVIPVDESKPAAKDSPPFVLPDVLYPVAPTIPFDGPSSVYRVCQDVIEVAHHRRLPHPKRGDYIACVVSTIKNRMGCPAPNAANKLAVRRMALNICGKHGVRPSHTRVVIEMIVAGVFVPDDADLRAAKVLASVGVEELRSEVANAGPTSAWYELFHPFKNRGASRVHGSV